MTTGDTDTVVGCLFSIHHSFYIKRTLNFHQMSALMSQMCQIYFKERLTPDWPNAITVVPFSLLSHPCVIKFWQWWMRRNVFLPLRHRGKDLFPLNFVISEYHFYNCCNCLSNVFKIYVLISVALLITVTTKGYKGVEWKSKEDGRKIWILMRKIQ